MLRRSNVEVLRVIVYCLLSILAKSRFVFIVCISWALCTESPCKLMYTNPVVKIQYLAMSRVSKNQEICAGVKQSIQVIDLRLLLYMLVLAYFFLSLLCRHIHRKCACPLLSFSITVYLCGILDHILCINYVLIKPD